MTTLARFSPPGYQRLLMWLLRLVWRPIHAADAPRPTL
jgi:hypothetical protein